jgi:hypothetical protein
MSRRSGQVGTIVKEGGWYRVRFRLDIPGQYQRAQKSIKICPVFGPGLLTRSERERRKVEIVNSFGANSAERFRSVVEGAIGVSFKEQAKIWLFDVQTRKRKPVKPATARGWQSYLDKWLNPAIGNMLIADANNSALREVVKRLDKAGLRPKSIRNIVQVLPMVVASAVDGNGEELYARRWNYEFADVPIIDVSAPRCSPERKSPDSSSRLRNRNVSYTFCSRPAAYERVNCSASK